MKKSLGVTFVITLLLHSLVAVSAAEEVLTNESIISMVRAGLSPGIVIKKIETTKTKFDISAAALMQLKKEKIPDEVIEAMLGSYHGSVKRSEKVENESSSDLSTQPEAGIYVLLRDTNGEKLVRIDPSTFNEKVGLGGTFWWAPGRRLIVPGAEARIQIGEARPVFYFYLNDKSASPNQVVLVQFDEPEESREIDIEEAEPFDYEKVAAGIYKVVPRKPLKNGEYCFYYGDKISDLFGGGSSLKVFDFGIRVSRDK